jgi:hypothetical protein
MPHVLQTAASSRSMSKAPGDQFLKQLADDVKKIAPAQVGQDGQSSEQSVNRSSLACNNPLGPADFGCQGRRLDGALCLLSARLCCQVVGHVLIRSSQHNVEALHTELAVTHAHRRMICVPIEVPASFFRYLRSAASRSFGPNDDSERSGVDFSMRTIGRRSEKPKSLVEGDDEDLEDDKSESAASSEDGGDIGTAAVDPHLMTRKELEATFKDNALEAQSVLFQHATRITSFARFLDKRGVIKAPLRDTVCP